MAGGGQIHVHHVTGGDYGWAFGSDQPGFRPVIDGVWGAGAGVTVDPFPAYPHDPRALDAAVAHVSRHVDLRWDVHLFSGDREEVGRSNGHSNLLNGYAGSEYKRLGGMIWLSGKRIPPHPAMTRHLVAHELGHNLEWMLQEARGEQEYGNDLIREYAEIRGLPDSTLHHGGGGTWHDSAHEVFACDFRIVVCNTEPEYWPHPGIVHPATLPGLTRWWGQALDQITADPAAEAAA